MENTVTAERRAAKENFSARDITLTAMFSVIIAICSWISVPVNIPFTLQTFAVFLSLLILGGKRGFFSVLVFIMLAAAGVPVLAGFTGGIGVMLGSTGGYIIGFLAIAGMYWLAEMIFGEKYGIIAKTAVLTAGLLVCYLFGTAWFIFVYTKNTGTVSITEALGWCVIPFIIPDIIKLAAAEALAVTVKKNVNV